MALLKQPAESPLKGVDKGRELWVGGEAGGWGDMRNVAASWQIRAFWYVCNGANRPDDEIRKYESKRVHLVSRLASFSNSEY